MKSIQTDKAPAALGPYSQAIRNKGFLFISGQLGIDPKTGKMANSFSEQAELVFSNLSSVLNKAEMTFNNVVKVTIYVTDLSNFPTLNNIYGRFFNEPFPARETVQVSKLPANGEVEISLIAMD